MTGPAAIRVPSLGQSTTEAVLIEWRVGPGAAVKAGDVVAVVETDKSQIEVEAPVDGVLGAHEVKAGDTQPVGAVLAWVVESSRRPVSPKARRLAAERGIDPSGLKGSGPDGLVVAADIDGGADSPITAAGTWMGRPLRERRRLSPVQATGARRTTESWRQAPHFVQFVDVDLTALADLRRRWREKEGPLARVTWTDVVVAAFARSLADHPSLNAAVEGDDLMIFDEVNIGVAVDSDRGLIVPVIAHADRRSLPELSSVIRQAAESGRGDDVPSTATVSNLGSFGIRAGTPVLNPPESVLLFVGAVEERAVAVDGQVTVRTMATLSFAFDHRATDGAAAARFVAAVRRRLEFPRSHL